MRTRNLVRTMLPAVVLFMAAMAVPTALQAAGLPKIVCIDCHGKLPGRLGEPVNLWQGSIHAANGIACHACHGGDPEDAVNAMNPARGFLGVPEPQDVPAFCGRCHVGVLKDFMASAHGRALALGQGGPTCVSCHGNHRVVKASLELINEKSCTRCHSFEQARLLRSAMEGTEKLIVGIDRRIAAHKGQGTGADRLEKDLFALGNRFHSLSHNLDAAKVRTESLRIQVELKKLEDALLAMDEERQSRKLAGGIAVAGALLAAGLLHLLRKSLDR